MPWRILPKPPSQCQIEFYKHDVIISVVYRLKSYRGTQFRIWATQGLRDFIVKGFAMVDDRLKRASGGNYFDEMLPRIRERFHMKHPWPRRLNMKNTLRFKSTSLCRWKSTSSKL
jgi:hypothetical protein